jgi:DNA-binding CsgD family transcriptional regulator
MGTVRFDVEQDAYDADVALVRDRLSPDDFDRAWEEGRAMSLYEAVAYATRGRGERRRPTTGWESLTPTETEVVRLIAEGLTNPEIAERMFVARATVKAHLGNVFRKLDVSTRSEMAAEATRREL